MAAFLILAGCRAPTTNVHIDLRLSGQYVDQLIANHPVELLGPSAPVQLSLAIRNAGEGTSTSVGVVCEGQPEQQFDLLLPLVGCRLPEWEITISGVRQTECGEIDGNAPFATNPWIPLDVLGPVFEEAWEQPCQGVEDVFLEIAL